MVGSLTDMASTHQTLLTSIDSRWSTRCTCKDVKAASLRAYQARCRLFWALPTVQGVRYRAADGSSSDRLLPKGRDARREHGRVNPKAGDVQQKLVSSTVSVEQAGANRGHTCQVRCCRCISSIRVVHAVLSETFVDGMELRGPGVQADMERVE